MSASGTHQATDTTTTGPPRPQRLLAPRMPEPPPAGSLPILASIAPVVGSCVLFLITRSPVTLVFAALGPLIAVAGFLDARWTRRRRARSALTSYTAAAERFETELERAKADERRELAAMHPSGRALDVGADTDRARWRTPDSRRTLVVVGRGDVPGSLRIDGAADEPRWTDAARIADAPVVVDAAEGIGIVGGPVLARAVARSVVVQLARQLPPNEASFQSTTASAVPGSAETGSASSGSDSEPPDGGWHVLGGLPHHDEAAGDPLPSTTDGAPTRVVVAERWEADARMVAPLRRRVAPGGVLIALSDSGALVPTQCRHLLLLGSDGTTTLVDGTGSTPPRQLVPTLLAGAEAERVVGVLEAAALTTGESTQQAGLVSRVAFADLHTDADRGSSSAAPAVRATPWSQRGLRVGVGLGEDGPVHLDLETDGPHALVGGTTGSGKSELLITWITALAASRCPTELSFLLIDCKGGSSFQAVESLPHVVGMVTDLEPTAAERVVSSLRAELRHRERVLAAHGARHLLDPGFPPDRRPARLVVVVDEFQALLDASPHLHQVFADLAARGRSLGLHLILCSQRPAAVAADAILANCTLRLSLRVTSRQDSTAVLGCPDAAGLPAGIAGRCMVSDGDRRHLFQVASTVPEDLLAVRRQWRGSAAPRRPWLDPLPERLELDTVRAIDQEAASREPGEFAARPHHPDDIVFGLADLPELQAQRAAVWNPESDGSLLVLGAGRTGRTTLLDTIAEQGGRRWRIDRVDHDPEHAWDTIMALTDPLRPLEATLLLVDDVESVLATAGDEHGAALRDALLAVLRDGGRRGIRVVLVASRLGGVIHRFSSQLDRTLVLRLADRQEHLVAGAPAACFDQRRPAGRAFWDDAEVQIALPGGGGARQRQKSATPRWRAEPGSTTVLVTRAARTVRPVLLREAGEQVRVIEPMVDAGPRALPGSGGFAPAPMRAEVESDGDGRATIVIVDPETWLSGRLVIGRDLPADVARADLLLHACSAGDFRQITRDRELPPLLGYGSGRAWWWRAGRPTKRVDLLDVT